MAEIIRDDKNEIKRIVYKDHAEYTAEVERPNGSTIRLWTKGKGGHGVPTDLTLDDARRFAHDVIDLAGGDR